MKVLRTDSGFYVHELRGACFVSWVSEKDKGNALRLSSSHANKIQEYVYGATGVETEIVDQ